MRVLTLAAVCVSGAFVTVPALAQSSGQGMSGHSSMSGASSQSSQSANSNGGNSRQELIQDLQKAGFTNIRVEPEMFVVHATNSQGQPVLMQITPDSMTAVTAINPHGAGSSGQGSQQAGRSSNSSTAQ